MAIPGIMNLISTLSSSALGSAIAGDEEVKEEDHKDDVIAEAEEMEAEQEENPDIKKKNIDMGTLEDPEKIHYNELEDSKGNTVKVPDVSKNPAAFQQFLVEQGYDLGKSGPNGKGVDGQPGAKTRIAANKYYVRNGIVPPNAAALETVFSDNGIFQKSYVGTSYKKNIDGQEVQPKTGEVSSGGEVTPSLVKLANDILPGLNDSISSLRLTGGNDLYHQSDAYLERRGGKRSDHEKGNAMDFTIDRAKNNSGQPALGPEEKEMEKQKTLDYFAGQPGAKVTYKMKNGKKVIASVKGKGFRLLNEYDFPTSAATAPHFHLESDDHDH